MTTKRKTAAEKLAEAEALQMEKQQVVNNEFLSEYPTRLLNLVHAYGSELSHVVYSVGDSEHKSFEFTFSRYTSVRLPVHPKHDTRSVDQLREDMEEAECFVETKREELRAERELSEKKSAVLSKLSKEERELLGL